MDLGNYTQPGLEGDAISFSSAQEFVQNLLNKGYVWDGASYNGTNLDATNYAGINFGNYDNTDDKNGISQKWVINLVHGVTPVILIIQMIKMVLLRITLIVQLLVM